MYNVQTHNSCTAKFVWVAENYDYLVNFGGTVGRKKTRIDINT
jgi:hypothetical protein